MFTRRELGHGGEKKGGLEMRQECISTSLSFVCKTRERLSSVPATPLEQGLGLESSFWAMPSFLPAHFCPAAKRERQQEERKAGKEIMKSQNCAYMHLLRI